MQFSVPQFVEVEDKIIGPLTLKQFLVLLGGGFIVFVLYKIFSNLFIFIVASLPVAALSLILGFGKFNGRTAWEVMFSGATFMSGPRDFIFRREALTASKPTSSQKQEPILGQQMSREEKLSRLQKLTYILDQDIRSERQLLKDKYINLK